MQSAGGTTCEDFAVAMLDFTRCEYSPNFCIKYAALSVIRRISRIVVRGAYGGARLSMILPADAA